MSADKKSIIAELGALQSMEKQHYAKLLSVTSITTTYDKRLGGYVTEATSKKLSPLPDDFFEIAVSTDVGIKLTIKK